MSYLFFDLNINNYSINELKSIMYISIDFHSFKPVSLSLSCSPHV